MIELLLAASLTLPSADGRTARDLWSKLPDVREEESAVADVEIWTDKEGRVSNCSVKQFAGNAETAKLLCAGIIGVRYRPARDHEGNRIHARTDTQLSVFPDNRFDIKKKLSSSLPPKRRASIIVLSVDSMPNDLAKEPRVGIRLLVGQAGHIEYCEAGKPTGENLASVVCEHAATVAMPVHRDRNGEPVSYVVSSVVEFELGK